MNASIYYHNILGFDISYNNLNVAFNAGLNADNFGLNELYDYIVNGKINGKLVVTPFLPFKNHELKVEIHQSILTGKYIIEVCGTTKNDVPNDLENDLLYVLLAMKVPCIIGGWKGETVRGRTFSLDDIDKFFINKDWLKNVWFRFMLPGDSIYNWKSDIFYKLDTLHEPIDAGQVPADTSIYFSVDNCIHWIPMAEISEWIPNWSE